MRSAAETLRTRFVATPGSTPLRTSRRDIAPRGRGDCLGRHPGPTEGRFGRQGLPRDSALRRKLPGAPAGDTLGSVWARRPQPLGGGRFGLDGAHAGRLEAKAPPSARVARPGGRKPGRPKPLGRGRFGLLAGTGARLETIGAAREAPNSSALGTGDLVPHCELFASDN